MAITQSNPLQPKPLEFEAAPHLSVHLISPAGYGKTTILATLPKPLLLIDVDGGSESLFRDDTLIRPEARAQISIFRPKTYEQLKMAVGSMWKNGPGGRPFASIAVDTMSWTMNNLVKGALLEQAGREKMELQDWGLYLERGLYIAKKMHELAMDPNGCHTVLTFHEADKGGEDNQIGKLGPAVSGQLFDIFPGIPNYVFYLRILKTKLDAATGKPVLERRLQTEADQRTPAKSRRKLAQYEVPDFEYIWDKVKPGVNSDGTVNL